jgi:type IV pilus assembly protein PilM
MFNLFSNNKSAFGLDISGSSLKIFHLEKQSQSLGVKAYSNTPLPKGLIANDTVTDNTTFDYLLKQTLEKPQFGRLSTNHAVVSLPEAKSFVRVIQIPHMSDAEADAAVPFEAESFIPLPIDQVYLDWQRVGQSSGEKMDVLIVASPREFVDKYISLVEKAGIKIVAMEVESQSCLRALTAEGNQDTMLIVDLDAYRSSLIMVEDGGLQFTSTVPIAGNTFTESIARTLGVSSAKAEMIKRKVGINNTTEYPNIKTSLVPILNNLTAEIKNILKFHNDHSEKQVSKIVFTGGSAKLNNLIEYLAPGFADMPTLKLELGNPWQRLPQLRQPPIDALESLNFTTAIGLAERGVGYEIN